MGHGIVTVICLWTPSRSGSSCQQKPKKRSRVQIYLLRKNKPTSGQRNKSDSRTKHFDKPVRKRDRDMEQKRSVLKKMCRMESSFIISLILVSNNNYWNPRKLHDQLRVTLTHTNTQWTKLPGVEARERERERHTHTTNSEPHPRVE